MENDRSSSSSESSVILEPIEQGMALEKCHKCGCMLAALAMAERAFSASDSPATKALVKLIHDYKTQMEPIAYDCLGCKVCLGAEATRMIAETFENSVLEYGTGTCAPHSPEGATICSITPAKTSWPPYPGDYVVGNPSSSIAVCTLASHDLPNSLMASGEPGIAISGKCDTENIGVEKVVLNILANSNIRWLILCGNEAEGHRPGDAFLKLKEFGVDAAMRIQNAASWRPILKNLTMLDVARFRQQVEVANIIGSTELATVLEAVRECAAHPREPMADSPAISSSLTFERIKAKAPKRLGPDPGGFFIILPDKTAGVIVCEHYENSGRLMHVIEGKDSALIAATAVECGLMTRLDHAAYLGRELAKAEFAMKTGATYTQDAALGEIPEDEKCSDSTCSCHLNVFENQISKL
jgi:tetrahydromethanopterin S-methyltransferase subunit A